MRAAAVLLAVVLLAGCVQQPAATKAATVAPATIADPFHPMNASGGRDLAPPSAAGEALVAAPGFAEPNIAVGYDGALYVGNPGGVWSSRDAGKTWAAASKVDGGGDGDIAVDANGTLYYLGLFGKDNDTIPFMASHDGGKTWSKPVDVAAGGGADREWIDSTPDGHVYATWRDQKDLRFNASTDEGATWLPKTIKVGEDGDEGPIAHDAGSGLLAIPVVDQAATTGVEQPIVHVYTSSDQGQTWVEHKAATLPRTSPVEPNGYASDFPVIAFDGNGTMYLVYSRDISPYPAGATPPEEGALYGIALQVSHDHGATWSDPQIVSDASKDARFPWIAAGAPGRIAIAWYENVRGIPGEMLPDEWNVKLYESIDADAASPKGVVATLTPAPNHLGALCTSGGGCLAADRSMLDFFEVAIDLHGQPVVAYASSTLGTAIGFAVKKTEIHYVTVTGTPLI